MKGAGLQRVQLPPGKWFSPPVAIEAAGDVDLQNAVLTVRGTKFGKCRLVPLHGSTRKALSRYPSRRDQYLKGRPASDFFFVTKRGTRLDKNNVGETFRALSRQTGLRSEFDSRGPRLHDFRHRFAIRTAGELFQNTGVPRNADQYGELELNRAMELNLGYAQAIPHQEVFGAPFWNWIGKAFQPEGGAYKRR